MNEINWKRKLTSRKFWVCIAFFVTTVLTIFKVDEGSKTQITALIMAGADVIAYILAEGLVDSSYIPDDKEEE